MIIYKISTPPLYSECLESNDDGERADEVSEVVTSDITDNESTTVHDHNRSGWSGGYSVCRLNLYSYYRLNYYSPFSIPLCNLVIDDLMREYKHFVVIDKIGVCIRCCI